MKTKEYNNGYKKKKNTLEETNIRFYNTEEWISDLKDKIVEITHSEQQKQNKNLKIPG